MQIKEILQYGEYQRHNTMLSQCWADTTSIPTLEGRVVIQFLKEWIYAAQ